MNLKNHSKYRIAIKVFYIRVKGIRTRDRRKEWIDKERMIYIEITEAFGNSPAGRSPPGTDIKK